MSERPEPRAVDPVDLVDPELKGALQVLPDLSDLSLDTLEAWRERIDPPREDLNDYPEIEIETRILPGLEGAPPIDAILYRPKAATSRVAGLLSLHGGGYVLGSAERDGPINAKLATDLGCAVLSINYRRAPEAPYPAPLDDCYAALGWLHRQADDLGIDTGRIGVRGLSAGGGLAAGLALLARDRKEFSIRHLALVYPMLDDRTRSSPSFGQFVWTQEANLFGWQSYLGGGLSGSAPDYAVPARAQNLHDLPPTFIAVGSIDLFVGESIDFAGRLIEAGVKTELHVYPGAYHGFDLLAHTAVSQAFARDLNAAIGRDLVSV